MSERDSTIKSLIEEISQTTEPWGVKVAVVVFVVVIDVNVVVFVVIIFVANIMVVFIVVVFVAAVFAAVIFVNVVVGILFLCLICPYYFYSNSISRSFAYYKCIE